jgi:prophage regulatory protein
MSINLSTADPADDTYLLRFPQVKARTGLSRTTTHRLIKEGLFPGPQSLGKRAVGWRLSAVKDWCANRPDARKRAEQQPEQAA